MTASEYELWIARGNAHRAEGRLAEAMQCFRNAAWIEHEALRRSAHAAARAMAADARLLGRRYAESCAAAFAAAFPLTWPRRTAGERLRVVVLVSDAADDAARGAMDAMVALPAAGFDLMFAAIGPAAPEVVAVSKAAGAAIAELPPQPDVAVAKALAVRDPDLIVDLAGLGAASGPLLAQRPARAVWTVASLVAAHAAPLVDRTHADVRKLTEALSSLRAEHDAATDCPVTAEVLAATWEGAVRAHQRGDRDGARELYAKVVALQPGSASAYYLLGILAREDGDPMLALRSFAGALESAPDYIEARLAAVRAATEAGDVPRAIVLCDEGIARAPTNAALRRALGHAHLARRDGAAAADAFQAAITLDPDDGETHYNHGVALQLQRNLREAERAYRRALVIAPSMTSAYFNLGATYQETGATDAAIAAYEAVLAADPRNVAAYKQLGDVLYADGRYERWLDSFRRFEANCPGTLPLAAQGLAASQHLGDFERVDAYLSGLARGEFRAADEFELVDCLEELLYLLLFFDVDPATIAGLARDYDATARRVYGEPWPGRSARKAGRLRVGYLSADLRDHVMGKMMWQAIRHHDQTRFELFFYSLSRDEDEWTRRFRGVASAFRVISDVSERTAAERIAADDLDILVDLSTHTKGARPGILAFKPARVQLTHVASAGTVGLSTVAFKLTDRYADVAGNQAFQVETLLPMEGCVYPYRHIAPAADHAYRREQFGLAADAVVIGAFASVLKLSRRCLALWRAVLDRVPRARLAFSPTHPAARDSYVRIAAVAGIASDRILFVPQGRDDAENQARYELVDFVLDPMPFGGVNGTLEALDMGVPVVTLVGERHGERTSYSILMNLGVRETVARTPGEYVDIAVRLAEDVAFMRGVRNSIRAGLAASPLVDMPRYARALEAAYEEALIRKVPTVLARSGV